MSDRTLALMHKQVRVRDNVQAHELLRESSIEPRMSFMIGYPGERPEDFVSTQRFIVDELVGRFNLFVFSFTDETMPVWADMEASQLRFDDPSDPDSGWSHVGMDSGTAWALQKSILDEARWASESAVLLQWQSRYELPLIPDASASENLQAEKAVERLAMLSRDTQSGQHRERRLSEVLAMLDQLGVIRVDEAGEFHSLSPLRAATVTDS